MKPEDELERIPTQEVQAAIRDILACKDKHAVDWDGNTVIFKTAMFKSVNVQTDWSAHEQRRMYILHTVQCYFLQALGCKTPSSNLHGEPDDEGLLSSRITFIPSKEMPEDLIDEVIEMADELTQNPETMQKAAATIDRLLDQNIYDDPEGLLAGQPEEVIRNPLLLSAEKERSRF